MDLVIFGTGPMAELAHFYFSGPGGRCVAGFAVDDAHHDTDGFVGLPTVPLSHVLTRFPTDTHEVFVAIGYADGNRARLARGAACRAMGYRLATYADPSAVNHGAATGPGCLLAERTVVAPFARLGTGVVLRPGAMVGHHNRIGDGAYLAPGAVLSGFCEVGARAFLGTGALVRDGVRIGADVVVGMGAVVTRDLTEPGVYIGNPARPKPPASQAA